MTVVEAQSVSNVVLFENLARTVNEDYLRGFLKGSLDIPNCHIMLSSRGEPGTSTRRAQVEFGSAENASKAIRELNGRELDGQNVSVSMYLESFRASPGKMVHLSRFPEDVTNADLYEMFSKYGTVMTLLLSYDNVNPRRLQSVCGTFLTEEQAQRAIQEISATPDNKFGLAGLDSNDRMQHASDGSGATSEAQRKQTALALLSRQYEDTIQSEDRVEELLEIFGNSFSSSYLLELSRQPERLQVYTTLAESALETGKYNITQLSDAALDIAQEGKTGSHGTFSMGHGVF